MPRVDYQPYLEKSRESGERFRAAVANYQGSFGEGELDTQARTTFQDKPIRHTEYLIGRMLDDLSILNKDPVTGRGQRPFSKSFRSRQLAKAPDMYAQQQLQRAAGGWDPDIQDIQGKPFAGQDFISDYISAPGGGGGMTLSSRRGMVQQMIDNITAGAGQSDDRNLAGLAEIFNSNPYLLASILTLAFPGKRAQSLIATAVEPRIDAIGVEEPTDVDWITYLLSQLPTQPFDLPDPGIYDRGFPGQSGSRSAALNYNPQSGQPPPPEGDDPAYLLGIG
jgi:hypothetical protein